MNEGKEEGKEEGKKEEDTKENDHSKADDTHSSSQQEKKMGEIMGEKEEEQFPSKLHFYQTLVDELEHTIRLQTAELEVIRLFTFLPTS